MMDSKIASARVAEIRKQLSHAEKTAELYYAIEAGRCPLCGGNLQEKTHQSETSFTVYIRASIRCSSCGVFGADVELKDELSSNCKGYNKLTALELAWSKISKYVIKE